MTDREKLIELLGGDMCKNCCCYDCEYENDDRGCIEHIKQNMADHLLANGVRLETEQATSDENKRWIPVSERLPNTIPCGAGTAYSEVVNILTSERKILTAIFDGTDFIADAEFWEAENEIITHWTPVPLPLPEPPTRENT